MDGKGNRKRDRQRERERESLNTPGALLSPTQVLASVTHESTSGQSLRRDVTLRRNANNCVGES